MKAYIANDKNGDIYDAIVVFAETRGKARAYAANHEVFDGATEYCERYQSIHEEDGDT